MTNTPNHFQWQKVAVSAEHAGLRLDIAVAKLCGYSRACLQRWIEEGQVLVNGKAQKKRYMVVEGDTISICPPPPMPFTVTPEPMTFDVLYEDSSLFIINKPPGLVVHPAPGNRSGTFVNGLVACLSDLECQDPVRPGLVHRLDKDTSGVLIAAKTPSALCDLSQQFQDRKVHKEYLAIVVGQCTQPMRCEAPIGRDVKNRQRMAVVAGGKDATTDFVPLSSSGEWTLVKAVPHTGRTHQVRVHLSSLRYPILGDIVYGNTEANVKWKIQRQLLHCWALTILHPVTKKPLVVQAPVPQDFREILGERYACCCTTCS